jgi:glycerophosphoryl diester phosphodiesterase
MPAWGRAVDGRGPLVIGHRGASAHVLENTVGAFERARTDGADGVELDVLLCRTGEVVVFHDDDLRRLANRLERVEALSLDELRAVALPAGGRIPTLAEAFEACGPELLVNVEMKAANVNWNGVARLDALADGVARVVDDLGVARRVLVSSFSPLAVRAWMRRAPAIPAALLFEQEAPLPLRRAWAAAWLRPSALNPDFRLCTRERVARWHARGYGVNVWTVDGEERVRACREMGVDGIITNDPAKTRALLG